MRYFALLLAVSFVTRLPSLFVRVIDADEAVYANAARGILKGLVLYRDIIDQKPPLIYYLYALFLGAVNDLRFVHAMSIIVVWLTAIVVYRLVANCFDRHSGVVAGILYAAFVSTVGYASNTEIFMNLPMVLAVWLFFEKNRGAYMIMLAGFCVGIACLIKQQAAVVMVPLLLMIIVLKIGSNVGRCFLELFALIAGAVIPIALALLYFWALDALNDFIHWAYVYNMRYVAPESGLLLVLLKAVFVAILPTAILWWYSLKRLGEMGKSKQARPLVFGFLWLVASIFAVALGLRFYTHYFVQLIPPLVFLAAQPISVRLSSIGSLSVFRRVVFFCFLIAPAVVLTTQVGIKVMMRGFECQKQPIVWASEYVGANTGPDDRIFVWGDALIGYIADRESSSRFMNTAFVFENRDPCYGAEEADVSKFVTTREFGMLMNDLNRHAPKLIVDTSSSNIHCWHNYPIGKFAPLADLINKLYKNVGEYDGIRIYRLQ